MEASLGVPTATSFREVPAKLLEVNRKVINGYLARTRGGQGQLHPPHRLRGRAGHRRLGPGPERHLRRGSPTASPARSSATSTSSLGLAVDMEKSDGSRTLLVPVIRDADTLDFRGFWARLRGPDPQGPHQQALARRLRRRHRHPHQPRHHRHGPVGAPAHARPGRDRRRRPPRLPGRVPGRRPRGARRAGRLEGDDGHVHLRPPHHPGRRVRAVPQARPRAADGRATTSTTSVFRSLGVPYEAVRWRRDDNPVDREESMLEKQMHVQTAHQHAPGPRPPHRRPRPAGGRGAAHAHRARPGHLRAHHLGPRPRVPHRRPRRAAPA